MLIVGSLAACTEVQSDGGAVPGNENGGVPINPGAVMKGPAFSDDSNVTEVNLTNIQVLRVDGTKDFTRLTSVGVTASLAAGTTTMPFAPSQYFNVYHDPAHFLAYHPAGTFVAGNPLKVNYTIDGSQDIIVTESRTAVYDRDGVQLSFQFEHKLALLELNVIAVDAATASVYGALQSASVNAPDKMTLTIDAAGNSSAVRTIGSVTTADMAFTGARMTVDGAAKNSSYVMVHPSSVIEQIKLTFAGRATETFDLYDSNTGTKGLKLEAGKKTVITATVRAHAILFAVTLEQWKVDPTNSGGEIEIGG